MRLQPVTARRSIFTRKRQICSGEQVRCHSGENCVRRDQRRPVSLPVSVCRAAARSANTFCRASHASSSHPTPFGIRPHTRISASRSRASGWPRSASSVSTRSATFIGSMLREGSLATLVEVFWTPGATSNMRTSAPRAAETPLPSCCTLSCETFRPALAMIFSTSPSRSSARLRSFCPGVPDFTLFSIIGAGRVSMNLLIRARTSTSSEPVSRGHSCPPRRDSSRRTVREISVPLDRDARNYFWKLSWFEKNGSTLVSKFMPTWPL